MKRFILTVAVLSLTTIFVSAQDRPAPAAQKLEQVARQLNLTPAQRAQIMPILKDEAPKVQAIKNDSSLSPMQKMEQLRALHQQTDPQMKSILTSEQYQTLKDIRRQEVEQAMRNRRNQ
jgi:hypothetical protein